MRRQEMIEMQSAPVAPRLPSAAVSRLPCRAHAPGYGKELGSAPNDVGGRTDSVVEEKRASEPYPVDRAFHAMLARFTGGVSPIALSLAYFGTGFCIWPAPLNDDLSWVRAASLGGAKKLLENALGMFSPQHEPWSLIKPQPQDRRFVGPEWERPPFNLLAQTFLLNERWWHEATTAVRGVAPRHEAVVEFSVRQMLLDMLAAVQFRGYQPRGAKKSC